MNEELKPCPFCKREAQQTASSGLVSCAFENCPAFLLAVPADDWNRRAQPAEAEGAKPDAFEVARHSKRLVEQLRDQLAAVTAERDRLRKDAERYRWLRNPDQNVSLVLDKMTGEIPADEFGCGGYRTYEYRAGAELDDAIDAAMAAKEA